MAKAMTHDDAQNVVYGTDLQGTIERRYRRWVLVSPDRKTFRYILRDRVSGSVYTW